MSEYKEALRAMQLERAMHYPKKKLSDDQALEVIRRSRDGERGVDLAKEYGVSAALISLVKNGHLRPWLKDEQT